MVFRGGGVISALAIAVHSTALEAQPTRSAVVTGVVRDSGGRFVAGAGIAVGPRGGPYREAGRTDATGRFRVATPGEGEWALRIASLSHAAAERVLRLRAGDSTHLEFVLRVPQPVRLAEIVTSSSAARDAFAPAPSATMSGEQVVRTMGTTLAQTLAATPGVHARTQGAAAAMPIVRGMTGDRLAVLQDGMRAGDLASTASDHGVTIDPLAIRSVELVHGPEALTVGTTVLGGVVNIMSPDVPAAVPTRRTFAASLGSETAAAGGAAQFEVSQPLGGRTALLARVAVRSNDDTRLGGGGASLANTSLRNSSSSLALARDGEHFSGRLLARRYTFEYGLPWRDDPGAGVRLRGWRHEGGGRGEYTMERGLIQAVRGEFNVQSYAHDEVNVDGSVGTALALQTRSMQLTAIPRRGPLAGGRVGISRIARRNDVAGEQALTPPNASEVTALFAHRTIAASVRGLPLRLPLALRLERASTRSDFSARFGAPRRRSFSTVSAAGGLSVPVARLGKFDVTVARGVRVPTPEELFSRAGHAGTGAFEIGNPALRAERSVGVEAAWALVGARWRASFSAYDNRVDGWVGAYPAGRDTTIESAGVVKSMPLIIISQRDARLRGIEGVAEWWTPAGISVLMQGDLLRARDVTGEALPFMPSARLGGEVRWSRRALDVGAGVRHAFAQRATAPGEVPTSAYSSWHVRSTWTLTRGDRGQTLSLRIDNLTDASWRDATSRVKDFAPGAGRNVSLIYRLELFGATSDRD